MKTINLFILLLMLTGITAAHSNRNEWLCRVSNSTALGVVAAWDSEHYGWVDMPADLAPFADFLYTDKDANSGYSLYYSDSAKSVWIIPIANLNDVSTDTNGDHEGQHDLCDVHIYFLPKD